jgi:hypothetical protein
MEPAKPVLRNCIQCSFADGRIEIEHVEQWLGIVKRLFPLHFQHIPLVRFWTFACKFR